ncbi:neurogenic locus notch homolog protein 2-like [Ruditapes philippinarum]|uniref:neurogenic locus notch homolog protein 2-like n=1 Tax=Ruditapes philippinarum TaxID=129788 RepID=UPI00295A91E7|nr:neurogenic locus notch homolog protein 2-like [Ruditapes philippinarum]
MATSWRRVWIIALLSSVVYQHAYASGQFYGGSMSYKLEQQADGSSLVIIELITGWVLGKGPCGAACSRTDIGRSTRSTRQMLLSSGYLGHFTLEQKKADHYSIETRDIDADVNKTYNETVIDVDEYSQWEQEKMHFSVLMEKDKREIDIIFEGQSWRDVSFQSSNNSVSWHFQTKIVSYIRSDTNKTNSSPRSLSRPIYRIALDRVSTFYIPVVDAEGDFIKCELARNIEAGIISANPPRNVIVYENCTISINASQAGGYADNSWIAVAVSVRDYNRRDISYGSGVFLAGKFSLSTTSVQFTVQVLQNLAVPEFVEPTLESGHTFIIYAGSAWSTEIYAKASANTTIDKFKAFGLQTETIILQNIQQDLKRPRISSTTMSWKPSNADKGDHVLCVSVSDNTGVESEEDRCFTINVRNDVFHYSSSNAQGLPYFVDIPSPGQMVNCPIHSTCLIALYVVSAMNLTDIRVTVSYLDMCSVGKIQTLTHKGQQVYKADIMFESSTFGDKKMCFVAKDVKGTESENVCITGHLYRPDVCMSAPCKNSGACATDIKTADFKCTCKPLTYGKTCENIIDLCDPDPCVNEHSYTCYKGLCYCKPGFSGRGCETNINDCPLSACNDHGMCKDGVGNYTCECFGRYAGVNCTIDKCPTQSPKSVRCLEAGCTNHSCNGRGLCSAEGHCTCPYGYYGHQCQTPKCDITSVFVGIISPTVKDGSRLICHSESGLISQCSLRVYVTGKLSSVPTIDIETSRQLRSITTVGQAKKSSVLPGIDSVYTTDVSISGQLNSTESQHVCVVATYTSSTSSVCYNISIVTNYSTRQENAQIKFLEPTMKDHSEIICTTWERCQILLYTSIASNRTSCNAANIGPRTGFVNGRCGIDDRDNDENDIDLAAKAASPCCEDVISPSAEVNVFPAHPRGPSCVTETSVIFDSVGKKEICFQSAPLEYQQLCYTVLVYANDKQDPCSSSPCLNNGHCFRTDQDNYKCVCQDNYVGDNCQTDKVKNSTDITCFSCKDLVDPSFCDSIERCHSNQVCFVESNTLDNNKIHYTSGCKDKQICNQQSTNGTTSCLQCCQSSFCNSQGCGAAALPPRQSRGPLCLDCARVRDPADCDQIAFCHSDQLCSIEKLEWGDTFLYHLGCASTTHCSLESNRRASDVQFETRSIPVCRSCCHDDFCNRNCTTKQTDPQQIFVG